MNFDLIKKLIRLANNNPNENEANLAARRVCKMLADYTFGQAEPSKKKLPDMWEDIMNAMNKQAKNRPPENPFRDRYQASWVDPPRYTPPKEEPRRDSWSGIYEEVHIYDEKAGKYRCPKCGQDTYFGQVTREYVCGYCNFRFTEAWAQANITSNKPTAKRKCTKCGLEVDTFRLKQEPFVCNPCSWQRF